MVGGVEWKNKVLAICGFGGHAEFRLPVTAPRRVSSDRGTCNFRSSFCCISIRSSTTIVNMQLFKYCLSALFLAACVLAAEPPKELKIETTYLPEDCPVKAAKGDKIKVHYVSAQTQASQRRYVDVCIGTSDRHSVCQWKQI